MSDHIIKTEKGWYLVHKGEIMPITHAVANCYKRTRIKVLPFGIMYTAHIQSFQNQSKEALSDSYEI